MTSSHLRSLRAPALLMLGLAASGCVGADGEPEPTAPAADPRSGEAIGEFVLHAQPRLGRATIRRLSPRAVAAQAQHTGPGLAPQVMADVNLQQDDVEGSGPANSVELVNNSIVDTFGTGAQGNCPANSFCADVTLNSFWSRTLNNTYVELTSITGSDGQPLSGHNATNSDPVPSTCQSGCPSNSIGLWKFQSPTVDTTHFSFGTTGVVAPGTANGASRTWVFANPDDADFYVYIRVLASTKYANYSLGTPFALPTYMNACPPLASGESTLNITVDSTGRVATQPVKTNSTVRIALPFQFTFYGVNYPAGARVNFSKWGNLTFSNGAPGANATPSTGNNSALPKTAPSPAVFPFWDDLAWSNQAGTSTTSGLCAKVIGNAAASPNRQVVISWQHVAASNNGNTGPFGSFSVVLNEGSEEIWLNYNGTVSGPGSAGWSATIGAQDASGATVAFGSTAVTAFPSANSRKVLRPLP